ncbi:MAG: MBL fold metallo-hydrolase [Eubacteriales bacterium]
MDYTIHIGGSRGTRPVCGAEYLKYGGDTSCYAIISGTYALVLDCGSGISNIKKYLHKCTKVDILLTHIHYDHILGLLDFEICRKGMLPSVYGTFDKWGTDGERGAFAGNNHFWPVPIPYDGPHNVEWGKQYTFGDGEAEICIKLFQANHPNEASIIQVQVKDIQILLMCDYEHGKPLLDEVRQPYDVLIYDGMYTEEEYERCKGYGHSTIPEGIKLAKEMGAKKLVITHLDPNKTDAALDEEEKALQAEFPNSFLARAGMKFEI